MRAQVLSKDHRTFHGIPAHTAVNAVLSRRDITGDEVWKKLVLDDGGVTFLNVNRSESSLSCVRSSCT
jgi:hypothetical protein